MQSITERAYAAAAFVKRTTDTSVHGPYRGEEHARTALRLAGLLGLHWDDVTITPDVRRGRTLPGQPLLATVTDPYANTDYVFLDRFPVCQDPEFELLDPCPICGGQVPLTVICSMADLGEYLARPALTAPHLDRQDAVPDTFLEDEGHRETCHFSGC